MAEENEQGQDKTEDPTDKKKKDSREQGQVAQSKDLASIGVLLAVMLGFVAWGGSMADQMMAVTIEFLTVGADNASDFTSDPPALLRYILVVWLKILGPVLVAAVLAGFLLAAAQVGLVWSWKPLAPDMKRFDPIKGLKEKLFSAQAIAEWLKSMLKVVVVSTVSYKLVVIYTPALVELADYDLAASVAWACQLIARLVGFVLLFMLAVAVADYGFSHWQTNRKMKMSLHELKEETKEQEGDPHLRGKMKSIMQEISRNRLVADMAEATMVVTNPSHYAVAIRYSIGHSGAPVVVARGKDKRAELIKDIARSNGVPRIENRPLARALYAQCKVGSEIPEGLYEAVAEVLAFVYRLRTAHSLTASGPALV